MYETCFIHKVSPDLTNSEEISVRKIRWPLSKDYSTPLHPMKDNNKPPEWDSSVRLHNLTGHIHDMSALLTLGTKIFLGWSDYKSAALNAGVNPPKADAVESSVRSGFTFRGFSVGEAWKHKHIPPFCQCGELMGGCNKTFLSFTSQMYIKMWLSFAFFQKEKHNSSRLLAWLFAQ